MLFRKPCCKRTTEFRHHASEVRGISELKQMSAIKVCNKILHKVPIQFVRQRRNPGKPRYPLLPLKQTNTPFRWINLVLDDKNFVFRHHASVVRGIWELKQMSAIKVCNKILILLFQPEIATQVDDVQQIIKKLYSSFLLDHAGVNSTFIIQHQLHTSNLQKERWP